MRTVVRHLTRCDPTWQILKTIEAEWGLSSRQAKRYLAKARDLIREEFRPDIAQLRAEQYAVAEQLKTELWKQGKYLGVLEALKFQAKLSGTAFVLDDCIKVVLDAGYEVRSP